MQKQRFFVSIEFEKERINIMDILFKNDDFVFSYRVGGILIHNNKILLQKPHNDDGYSIVGGHISAMETTEETLIREFKEELNIDININKLCAVGEVFFPWGKRPCHQICLYYKVSLKDEKQIQTEGIIKGWDFIENKSLKMDFHWLPADKLNQYKIYPEELMKNFDINSENIVHFISRQL